MPQPNRRGVQHRVYKVGHKTEPRPQRRQRTLGHDEGVVALQRRLNQERAQPRYLKHSLDYGRTPDQVADVAAITVTIAPRVP